MTVAELIKELEKVTQELDVYCDSIEVGIVVESTDNKGHKVVELF